MNVTPHDWIIASLITLAAIVLTMIPYALGYAFARPGTEFTGIVMNPEDSQSYFAKMLQGYDGHWLYTIPFTPEEHAPAFVGGFYLALGHLARLLGLSLGAMWHLVRIASDLILFLATFGFVVTFLHDPAERWTAYLLAIFGSGLGWLLFLLKQTDWLGAFPVDFKMPEAHLFFTALTFPHAALGTALIMVSFWLVLKAAAESQTRQWLYAAGAGLANLALSIIYPFLIYLVAITLGLYWIYLVLQARRVPWRPSIAFAIAFLIPAPVLLYYARTLATNPVFRAWDAQAVTPSPPLPHYLVAYGVMLLLGLLTLRLREFAFLWAWVAAVALLVYAPLNPQRRFVEGVQIPLAILASVGIFRVVFPWIEQTRGFRRFAVRRHYSVPGLERLFIVAFLALMSLSNVYILSSVSVTAAVQQLYPLFRPSSESAAVDWLRANTARSEVILGAYETGNYVAAQAGNRVVLGHWAETVDWQRKFDEVTTFYNAMTEDAWRRELLARYRVRYIWFGPREQELGNFDATRVSYLEPAYSNSDITIYRVRQ